MKKLHLNYQAYLSLFQFIVFLYILISYISPDSKALLFLVIFIDVVYLDVSEAGISLSNGEG